MHAVTREGIDASSARVPARARESPIAQEEVNQGTMFIHWAEHTPPGATVLAFCRPGKPVAKFKFTQARLGGSRSHRRARHATAEHAPLSAQDATLARHSRARAAPPPHAMSRR